MRVKSFNIQTINVIFINILPNTARCAGFPILTAGHGLEHR